LRNLLESIHEDEITHIWIPKIKESFTYSSGNVSEMKVSTQYCSKETLFDASKRKFDLM
jgi:hypothetical protein